MPTLNRITIPMKINGDFSKNSSRTRIVMDEETKGADEKSADSKI